MPIDSEHDPDLIVSDLLELEDDARHEDLLKNSPVVVCSFDQCTEQEVIKCRKCGRNFCLIHAHRFSPNFCKDCFPNLACIESKFTRTWSDYDEKKDEIVEHKQSCSRYYMDGMDWPHVQAWIDTFSDEELNILIRFHYFVMKLIEAENETRKVKKYKRLREQPVTKSTVQTKSVLKKTVQVDTADELRKRLKKQKIPDIVIEQMIQAMNKS